MRTIWTVSVMGMALCLASPAMARDDGKPFLDCRAEEDAAARLACYDAEADALVAYRADKRNFFGLPDIFGGSDPLTAEEYGSDTAKEKQREERIDEIQFEIVQMKTVSYNKLRVYLENGQVWEQSGRGQFRPGDGVGDTAHIRRLASGSYNMQINGRGAGLKVRRIR